MKRAEAGGRARNTSKRGHSARRGETQGHLVLSQGLKVPWPRQAAHKAGEAGLEGPPPSYERATARVCGPNARVAWWGRERNHFFFAIRIANAAVPVVARLRAAQARRSNAPPSRSRG